MRSPGFTLMEIMVVIVIIGFIAAFAIPGYNKMISQEKERAAINGLQMIREARNLYVAQNNTEIPLPLNDIDAINQTLHLSIIPDGLNYSCLAGIDEYIYSCIVAYPAGGWSIHFGHGDPAIEPTYDPVWNGVIHCYTGTCPTCLSTTVGCTNSQ